MNGVTSGVIVLSGRGSVSSLFGRCVNPGGPCSKGCATGILPAVPQDPAHGARPCSLAALRCGAARWVITGPFNRYLLLFAEAAEPVDEGVPLLFLVADAVRHLLQRDVPLREIAEIHRHLIPSFHLLTFLRTRHLLHLAYCDTMHGNEGLSGQGCRHGGARLPPWTARNKGEAIRL